MSEFEQAYFWWLEELSASQDRCEYAVAAIIRYLDAGEPVPDELATAYHSAHADLQREVAGYPTPEIEALPLASSA